MFMTLATVADESTVGTVTYTALFAGVLVGAIIPVIPTGALVSAAAATAIYSTYPWHVVFVLIIGAVAALVGDMVLFGICSLPIGHRVLAWLRRRARPELLERSHRQLDQHGIGVLILSRLIPAGRIPIMAATLILGWKWRRYLSGDSVAAVAWSMVYAAIGVLSGSLFDEPWQGIALAIGLVILISIAPTLIKKIRHRAPADQPQTASPPADGLA